MIKSSTLSKRLENRYKGSKTSVAYKVVSDVINDTDKSFRIYGDIIRTTESSKRGVLCYMGDIVSLLRLLGIKHRIGNDSPRGGANGNYIKITHKIER